MTMQADLIAAKINRAIEIEKTIKNLKTALEEIKAGLQAEALAQMENKNLKYVQLFGDAGSFEASHKVKFEVDNFAALVEAVGDLARDKVTRKEVVKYEVEPRFREALIALAGGDYARYDIAAILSGAGISDPKQMKLALKKLKGDYKKDKALLESLGLGGDLEEELDAIRAEKNRELVERFFEIKQIDQEKLRRSIFVEDSLSVGLSYDA